jgi:hypothetical protein
MQTIFEATKDFPLDKLVLATPIVISSGIYFIKYLIHNESVYIQTPKCITRQGIIKGGKKMYCDLLFTNENDSFIKWIEDLESYSFSYIYKCRERWFDTELELDDIANSFISILKIFKSGKYYVLRTYVPSNENDCLLKLYDENENAVDYSLLSESTNVIPILEFKGIKCTSRNFQVDIEIKQMMIIKPTMMFEKCVIRNIDSLGNTQTVKHLDINNSKCDKVNDKTIQVSNVNSKEINKKIDSGTKKQNVDNLNSVNNVNNVNNINNLNNVNNVNNILNNVSNLDNVNIQNVENVITDVVEFDKCVPDELKTNNGLLEIDLEFDNTINREEIITLTTRNEVYYKIYQEAMNKAKEAKTQAIKSYLEAKQIKNLYMLDDINDNTEELKSVLNIK